MRYLITGGAGFIGINFADKLLQRGEQVIILDNFSKVGSRINLKWLTGKYKKNFQVIKADIGKDRLILNRQVKKVDVVFHLAAQTAVTTSVKDPQRDFQTNVIGTFNLLESIRVNRPKTVLIYASTNKVYGPQGRALDFETPYGCSKGAGDQYVLDYCRTFGLKTVVFRQSCIYGPHQFGNEDQGWVAWFVSAALQNKRITIYGDGKQVRDILYVDDLFAAWDTAVKKITQVKGIAFDIGGGIKNKISLLELIAILEKKLGRKVKIKFAPERLGDQEIFVSDNYLVKKLLGFSPKVDMESGLEILFKNEKKPYC